MDGTELNPKSIMLRHQATEFQRFQGKRLKHFDGMIARGYIGNRIMIYEKE
jgi:hypothetical protein